MIEYEEEASVCLHNVKCTFNSKGRPGNKTRREGGSRNNRDSERNTDEQRVKMGQNWTSVDYHEGGHSKVVLSVRDEELESRVCVVHNHLQHLYTFRLRG